MKQLVSQAAQHSTGNLVLLALVKVVAMTVASASGFRGGRIFPATFVGVALGLFVHSRGRRGARGGRGRGRRSWATSWRSAARAGSAFCWRRR